MSDIQKRDSTGRRSDHVEDAEFVDVDELERGIPPVRKKTPLHHILLGCAGIVTIIVGAVFVFGIIFAIVTGPGPAGSSDNEVVQEDSNPAVADTGQALPSLTELLAANDARICSHPDAVATIRARLLPIADSGSNGYGLSEDEFARALELVRVKLTEVSASNIRADIHEISCEANLRYGDKDSDYFLITYKMRPSANPDDPPVMYVHTPAQLDILMMSVAVQGAVDTVKSERPKPAEADQPPKDPVAAPQADDQHNTVTDEDSFAPHAQ